MNRALLDINVLLALIDADHADHERAHVWWSGQTHQGWATCAITENGFVRVMSQPRYPNPATPAEAVSLLRGATTSGDHAFWSCDRSLLDESVILTGGLLGPKQITDAYLLTLAVTHGGRLATLDRRISTDAVVGSEPRHLEVLEIGASQSGGE